MASTTTLTNNIVNLSESINSTDMSDSNNDLIEITKSEWSLALANFLSEVIAGGTTVTTEDELKNPISQGLAGIGETSSAAEFAAILIAGTNAGHGVIATKVTSGAPT